MNNSAVRACPCSRTSQCDLHTDGPRSPWVLTCRAYANQREHSFLWQACNTFYSKPLLIIITIKCLKAKNKVKNHSNSILLLSFRSFPQLTYRAPVPNPPFYIVAHFRIWKLKTGWALKGHCQTTVCRCYVFTPMVLKLTKQNYTETNQTSHIVHLQMLCTCNVFNIQAH